MLCLSLLLSSVSVPAQASSAAAAGALTLTSSGSGAIGAGSAAISPTAFIIFLFCIAGGIIVSNLYEYVQDAHVINSMLSSTTRAELESIDLDGGSFTLSEEATEELTYLCTDYYYDDAGLLKASGVTLDATDMLAYDYSHKVASSDPPVTDIYKTVLSSSGSSIEDTGIVASLVTSPFNSDTVALKLQNVSTGKSLTFEDTALSSLHSECDSASYMISKPVISENTFGQFGTVLTSGFWIMRICNAGHSEHYKYVSQYVADSNGSLSGDKFLWTGADVLDRYTFTYQNYDLSFGMWKFFAADNADSIDYINSKSSAMVGLLADQSYTVSSSEAYDFPKAQVPLYLPTAAQLNDVNTITSDYVLTGEASTDIPGTDTGTDAGFWATLWDWLTKIWEAITSLPTKFWELMKSGFDSIVSAIKDLGTSLKDIIVSAFEFLFKPSEEYFEDYFTDLQETFDNRFGLLTYPISLLYEFLSAFADAGNEDPVLSWTSWSYQGTEFISEGSVNLNDFLENETFKNLHDIYFVVTDASIIFLFLKFCQRKYNSVVMH